ncbi:MAG: hypothetical protein N2257_07290 [Thermodesulfovibrionales bacterium]|nr:hypothetical protein [Thermodesulfovibrionales bacterium]
MNFLMSQTKMHEDICPYFDLELDTCMASCSSVKASDGIKSKFCLAEDYDSCPIFLAKILMKKK